MFIRLLAAKLSRSFFLVPALVGLAGPVTAALVVMAGDSLHSLATAGFPAPTIETARVVHSTIAGSALTVLSLVYSVTLVVFTLAAGNIAPRLLSRFTDDSFIQTTAGVLAATFLYSIVILQRLDSGVDHALSTGVAVLWAALSISLVIIFIHHAATRITIDEEIARIAKSIGEQIERLLREVSEAAREDHPTLEDIRPRQDGTRLNAVRNGYVSALNLTELFDIACRNGLFLEVHATPGQFVVPGTALLTSYGPLDEECERSVRKTFHLERNRSPEEDLDFSILLMIEIAQRAMSPGLNDGFTAVAVIDHLSAAFAKILTRHAPEPLLSDTDGNPRLWCDLVSVDRLLASALHPLRREVLTSITVTLRFLSALERMAEVTDSQYRPLLKAHLDLVMEDLTPKSMNSADRTEIERICKSTLAHLTRDG